jgi:hypothetical protein
LTAVNTILTSDSVLIVTDTAGCDGNGNVVAFMSKILPMPHLGAALALRGHLGVISMINDLLIQHVRSLDDMYAYAPEMMQTAAKKLAQTIPQSTFLLPWDLTIAGVNDDGPCAFMIANHGMHVQLKAFEILDIEHALLTPVIDLAVQAAVNDEPLAHLPRILAAQRRSPHPQGVVVGGSVVKTTIRRNSILSEVIGRWPDAIGRKMDVNAPLAIARDHPRA